MTDGLQGNTFHAGHCKTRDGAMLFGGHNGFNLFYPVAIKESSFRPPVLLSEMRIFNELIEVGKPHKNTFVGEHPVLNKPLFLCDELRLSYRDYILTLGFSSLDFSAPHKNKFAYMLENFEDEWNYTDASKRFATYTNLKPGEYIFKVKGTNSDGIWNERPASLKLIITPPFWQTWWFRTVAISFFFLIAYAVHRMWVQVKLENLLAMERIKIQEAEAIRKKVAMDFHDEMGNQLASITAIINLINIRQSKKEFYIDDLLTRLNQHAQTLFYGTKDFIWSIDPKSDKVEVILMNIKDFGEDLFDRTGISFHFIKELHDSNFTFPAGASRHITLICKEVFTNIVKHASCKSVNVKAVSQEGSLSISIKDDGCGFDMESLKRAGNGLENMRIRAKKINAEISIQSKPNLGTEITLHVLIPKKGEDKKKVVLDLAN
jgi:signal transduction histidine kinase